MPGWRRILRGIAGIFALGILLLMISTILGEMMWQRTRQIYRNEKSAVLSLYAVNYAVEVYTSKYSQGFPVNLKVLGPGEPSDCNAANLIGAQLAAGQLTGYRIEYQPGPVVAKPAENCVPGTQSYTISVRPVEFGRTGRVSYFCDQSGIVHWTSEDRAARSYDRLLGHTGGITDVAFSTDGHWLATASWDHRAEIWEVNTGQEVRVLLGHTDKVNEVRFSTDGRWVATVSSDKTVKLWETGTWRLRDTLFAHNDAVTSLAFSPDGRWLATGSEDKSVIVWEVATGRQVRKLEGHDSDVTSVAFSPHGDLLAVATGSHKIIELWDTRTWRLRQTLESKTWSAREVAFSPDGRWLVSAGFSDAKLWDLSTGRGLDILVGHTAPSGLSFSPNGRLLASEVVPNPERSRAIDMSNSRIKLWETGTWREVRTIVGRSPLAFSPDGRWLASCKIGELSVTLWDAGTGQPLRTLP